MAQLDYPTILSQLLHERSRSRSQPHKVAELGGVLRGKGEDAGAMPANGATARKRKSDPAAAENTSSPLVAAAADAPSANKLLCTRPGPAPVTSAAKPQGGGLDLNAALSQALSSRGGGGGGGKLAGGKPTGGGLLGAGRLRSPFEAKITEAAKLASAAQGLKGAAKVSLSVGAPKSQSVGSLQGLGQYSQQSAGGPLDASALLDRSLPPAPASPAEEHSPAGAIKKEADTQVALRGVMEALVADGADSAEEAALPWGVLGVPLLRHQAQAVAWMRKREEAVNSSGGLLADDQGLGKTVTTIALMLLVPSPTVAERLLMFKKSRAHVLQAQKLVGSGGSVSTSTGTATSPAGPAGPAAKRPCQMYPGGHLIVCPTSVLRQWARELHDKIAPSSALSVLIHHGPDRTKSPLELLKYDVVITTYAILTMDLPREGSASNLTLGYSASAPELGSHLAAVSGGEGAAAQALSGAPGTPSPPRDGSPGGSGASLGDTPAWGGGRGTGMGGSGRGGGGGGGGGGSVGPTLRVQWYRVVMDEAQMIKNPRTQAARAAWAVKAKRRWALSGTPMQNSVDDLYSYFRFLKQAPYDDAGSFRSLIREPIARNPELGFKRLQTILQAVMLRRTKSSKIEGRPIVNLPAREVRLETNAFDDDERAFYRQLEARFKDEFAQMSKDGSLGSNYVNILWMLLRLRQACNHPHMVKSAQAGGAADGKGSAAGAVAKADLEVAKALPSGERARLLACCADLHECAMCMDIPEEATVCPCGHVFCRQCVMQRLAAAPEGGATCAVCMGALAPQDAFLVAALRQAEGSTAASACPAAAAAAGNGTSEAAAHDARWAGRLSCKTRRTVQMLRKIRGMSEDWGDAEYAATSTQGPGGKGAGKKGDGRVGKAPKRSRAEEEAARVQAALDEARIASSDSALAAALPPLSAVPQRMDATAAVGPPTSLDKAIVFSQWTSMLDELEEPLRRAGLEFRRLDGTMSVAAREKALTEFEENEEVAVILMSLKAASVGLNLVCANHVFLLDVWWNPTVEDQAIDRAHRLGQRKTVHVHRFTIRDTIEDRILHLQEKKREMVAAAFGEDSNGQVQRSRLTMDDLLFLFKQ